MAWQDDIAAFGGSSTPYSAPRQRSFGSSRSFASSNWMSSFASSSWGGSLTAAKPKKPGYTPAAFPESVGIPVPWSSNTSKAFAPPGDTTGDWGASLGASMDNAIWNNGYLNLANMIPWAEERTFVAAKALADSVIGEGNPVSSVIDGFGTVVRAVSEPIAAAIEWLPNTIRDAQLNSRASIYRALVTGESVPLLDTLFNALVGVSALNVMNLPAVLDRYRSPLGVAAMGGLVGIMTPVERTMMAELMDIPDSVKTAIKNNPRGDITKYLDAAPEGRAFSYIDGIPGMYTNLANMGGYYGLEMIATGGVVGLVRAASGGVAAGANVFGYLGRASTASNLYGMAAKGASGMAKAQRILLASGITYFGASTLTDVVLRTMGNEKGVAWLDQFNRTTLISDSLAVQLVSSFSVNPIAAQKMALKGQLKVLGSPLIVLDKATGGKLLRIYDHEDVVLGVLGKMYGTTALRAAEMIGPNRTYPTIGHAFDQVMSLAADSFIQKLPDVAKNVINAMPRSMRTRVLFSRYANQILREVDEPSGLVARFRRDTSYHDFYGEFDPGIAAVVTRDYAEAALKLGKAQEKFDAVPGYAEYLNPEGQGIVAETIEGFFTNGRQATLSDLNMLTAKHPSMRGLVHDLVAQGANGKAFVKPGDIVPREVFDTALARATEAYSLAEAAGGTALRTAAGVAPILRPKAHVSEWAEALETTQETVEVLRLSPFAKRTAAQDSLVYDLLRSKNLATEAELASGKADDLWATANDWMTDKTAPWVKRGEDVAALEAEIGVVLDRVAQLTRSGGDVSAAKREAGELQALLAEVRDPQQPFAATMRYAERAETAEVTKARRMIDAATRVETIRLVREAIAPAQQGEVNSVLHSVEQAADGSWVWIADARAVWTTLSEAAVSMFPSWRWRSVVSRQQRRGGGTFMRASAGRQEQAYQQTPAVYQLGQVIDSPGFLRHLRSEDPNKVIRVAEGYTEAGLRPASEVTFGQVADMIAARKRDLPPVTEISQGMIEAMGAGDRAGFIAKVGALRGIYDDALAGTTEYNLGRTKNIKVLPWAVDYAATHGKIASIYTDPGVDVIYGNALNDLQTALDTARAGVRTVVEGNPQLLAQAREAAVIKGQTVREFLDNPANDAAIRTLLPAKMPPRYVPGKPVAETPLDKIILAKDHAGLVDSKIDLEKIRSTPAAPIRDVPLAAANALAAAPRLSRTLESDLNAAGIRWQALIPEALWEKSVGGADALAAILTGNLANRPRTIMGLLDAVKQIENGNAANMGMGAQLTAEAQDLARRVVNGMIGDVRRAGTEIGVVGKGGMLNPYTMTADGAELLGDLYKQELAAGNLVIFRDKMGLQYGLKARRAGTVNPLTGQIEGSAVAIDMNSVPGLAEELLVGRFQPWQERVGAARVNQVFGRLFHLNNQQVMFEARGRFETQLAKYGIPAKAAEAVWNAWRTYAKESRGEAWRLRGGRLVKEPASSALYATEKNIPNSKLETVAREALEFFYRNKGGIPPSLDAVRLAEEMRIAGSFTRRLAKKVPVMGDFLADIYGTFAHNEWATTNYFLFRFKLDVRFHAQNKVEGSALYYGRAGLKIPEIDEGMFGMNRKIASTVDDLDTMSNTGYPFAVTREEWIYRTLLAEQPDALRGLVSADPAIFRKALAEIAERDPELSVTIAHMGHTPDQYLRVMDAYYGKLMRSADPEALIAKELANELIDSPQLAEVYSRIYDRNVALLDDIRSMMYGNPNRGQLERTFNSFLLFWPLSYQIKATKWLLNIMYGKIGGIQTGGLGAYAIDQVQALHERKLVEDPEYAKFFEDYPTLVFAAQMLIPMSPASMSVGLSPLLRNIFFPDTAKSVFAIGPIYTITRFVPGIAGDIYPAVKDIPVVGNVAELGYKVTTGWQPPKEKEAVTYTPSY